MGTTGTIRALKFMVWLAMAAGFAGWLCMWLTEEAIWAPQQPHCTTFAMTELKGQTYKTCSYLATRYRTGEYTFAIAALVMAAALIAGRRQNGRRRPIYADAIAPRSNGKQ